jgi:hypothetical protein
VSSYNTEEPWTRQPFDGDLSWFWFQQYLTLPAPRRLSQLRDVGCPLSLTQLKNLEWDDGWKARATLWDAHLDQLRRTTIESVVQEDARMRAERQMRQARKLARLGALELDKLLQIAAKPESGAGLIQPRDITRMIAIGVRTERLAAGDVTDRIETGPDLSKLSVEELRQLRELQEKSEQGEK